MYNHRIVEALIAKQTGDSAWASNYKNFGGDRKQYDKYFKDGKLKEGYSLSGDIGGSEQMFSQKVRGEMVRTKDARHRKDDTTFEIYKLPEQKAAPAPVIKQAAAPKPAAKPKPVQLSKEVATAIGRSEAYQDTLMGRDGDYVIADDEKGITDFNEQTEQNIKNALKPYFQRDVDPTYAQSYADWHKLQLGDNFKLTKLV